MDFLCYLHEGWQPLIRPAEPTRPWMDATPEAFAYRCLPLNIANAHGWEILTPVGFEAYWRGGPSPAEVVIRSDDGMPSVSAPVSLFGQGTFTIHIQALFRTPPGWNLLVGGSPNRAKEGVAALSGVIETDWSPYTFTMNWRFTRACTVEFTIGEPICLFFPIQRGTLEKFREELRTLESVPSAGLERLEIVGRFAQRMCESSASDLRVRWTADAADAIAEKVRAAELPSPRMEGYADGGWILIDLGSVVAHGFTPDQRQFYNIERLWGRVAEVRAEAQGFAENPQAVLLIAAANPPSILLAASKDSGFNAGAWLKPALAAQGGRGGGSPTMAQGSVASPEALEAVIARFQTAAE